MGNDKHSILEAMISSNNNIWGNFHMHPLKINMRLASAASARAHGGLISHDEYQQLQYADMLIAFWDGTSKGTKHMIDLANKRGIRVVVIDI